MTVSAWPQIKEATFYTVKILNIAKRKSPPGLQVELEHLDKSQTGRKLSFLLSLPCRPQGMTASFLKAVGFRVEVGRQLAPTDAVGRRLKVKFAKTEDGSTVAPAIFAPVPKEKPHEHQPESTAAQPTATDDPPADRLPGA